MVDLTCLLQPIEVNGLRIKNRLVMAPMHTGFAHQDGSVSERLIAYLAERARGGVGLLMTEFAYTDDKGALKANRTQIGVESDERIPGLARLAASVKAAGARAAVQICHAGAQRDATGYPTVGPSPVRWSPSTPLPRELTIPEIQEIVASFGAAARRVKQAGCDLVEIHGSHGYLITNFLSGYSNRRQDEYGGSLEKRMRFALDIVAAVRQAVGPDFPIGFRMNGEDYADAEGGNTVDDQIQVARALERAGVDLLHISGGMWHGGEIRIAGMYLPRGPFRAAAARIKAAVGIPVIVSASMGNPVHAAEAVASGEADLVSCARQFLANSRWPSKIGSRPPEEIITCIRCNECLKRVNVHHAAVCAINPFAGRETDPDWQLQPTDSPKRVLVVGGGPAGLQAATVAAWRGHRVRLAEQTGALGGQLLAAGLPDFKLELRGLIAQFKARAERAGVAIELNRRIDGGTADELEADFVVVATGSVAEPPLFDAAGGVTVQDVESALQQDGRAGPAVVYGSSSVALEVAWWLADRGAAVTLVSPVADLAGDVQRNLQRALANKLAERGVQCLTGVQLRAVGAGEVLILDRAGRTQALPAERLVFEPIRRSSNKLARVLTAAGTLHVVVGDAAEPGRLFEAIHSATAAALRI